MCVCVYFINVLILKYIFKSKNSIYKNAEKSKDRGKQGIDRQIILLSDGRLRQQAIPRPGDCPEIHQVPR